MICTLICKKRESDDGLRKWVNYSMVKGAKNGKGGTWYNVKFVKDCAAPQVHKIAEGVGRAFIELDATCTYDIKEQASGNTLFVESYKNLTDDTLKEHIAAETKRVEEYRAEREKARKNFLDDDDTELSF